MVDREDSRTSSGFTGCRLMPIFSTSVSVSMNERTEWLCPYYTAYGIRNFIALVTNACRKLSKYRSFPASQPYKTSTDPASDVWPLFAPKTPMATLEQKSLRYVGQTPVEIQEASSSPCHLSRATAPFFSTAPPATRNPHCSWNMKAKAPIKTAKITYRNRGRRLISSPRSLPAS